MSPTAITSPVGSLRSLIRSDLAELARVKGSETLTLGAALDVIALPSFWAVFIYRLAHFLHTHHVRVGSRLLYFLNMLLFATDIAPGAAAGPGLVVPHPPGVGVAGDVVLGARCHLLGGVRIGGSGDPTRTGHAVIGDDVWLMDGAKVFGPVHVGDRSIVSASAILTRSVPPDTFVYGPRAADTFRPLSELGLENHAERGRVPTA